jgi:hypothetical protein
MNRARKTFYTDFNGSDQRKLFKAAKNDLNFSEYEDPIMLANDIGEFFIQKIEKKVDLNLVCQLQTCTTCLLMNLLH